MPLAQTPEQTPEAQPAVLRNSSQEISSQKPSIGRPRLLADPEKRRTVCAMIATGAGFEGAARHVGCSVATIRNEMQRDETFAEQVRQAETGCELFPLQALRNSAKSNWRAAAWLLERMHPEQFARKKADAVSRGEVLTLVEEIGELVAEECLDNVVIDRVQERLDQWRDERLGETPPARPPREPLSELELFSRKFDREQDEFLYGSRKRPQPPHRFPLPSIPRRKAGGAERQPSQEQEFPTEQQLSDERESELGKASVIGRIVEAARVEATRHDVSSTGLSLNEASQNETLQNEPLQNETLRAETLLAEGAEKGLSKQKVAERTVRESSQSIDVKPLMSIDERG